jgi:stage II sporulation protein D
MISGRYLRLRAAIDDAGRSGRQRSRGPMFTFLTALVFILSCSLGFTQITPLGSTVANVRIGVLGLFHPKEFTIAALPGQALVVDAGGEKFVLEQSSGMNAAMVRVSGSNIVLEAGAQTVHTSVLAIGGRGNNSTEFVLGIPGKIARHYRGMLEIRQSGWNLLAVVTMDRETAVASIVAAESLSDTPIEALKAQAVATRSYLTASRGRHRDFDFCDTTHCQFLREPPGPDTAAGRAVEATRDMILVYESEAFAAMYTRSCAGRTRTPAELGLPAASYPYYNVECKYCRAHPERWLSRISTEDAATLRSSNEGARLRAVHQLGWSTIPSDDFTMKKENGQILLEGTGQGHGIGLCQAGAKAMAADGADFREILSHYYPNSVIVSIPFKRQSARQP